MTRLASLEAGFSVLSRVREGGSAENTLVRGVSADKLSAQLKHGFMFLCFLTDY